MPDESTPASLDTPAPDNPSRPEGTNLAGETTRSEGNTILREARPSNAQGHHFRAVQNIRVFISSPGDVAEERDRARQVVESLRRRYAGRFYLKPVLWEELPLQADMSFQQGIDLVLSREQGIDIAVFVLWSRLGSPVGALIPKPDGGTYRSGTEREFELVLTARRQSRDATGEARPHVLVYTRRDEVSFEERLRGKTTHEKDELIQQKKMVEGFLSEEFKDAETGTNIRAYHSFDRPVTFSQRLRQHLVELLDQLAGGAIGETVWDIEKQGPPFLGLEAFQPRHADVFFGREEEILEVRHALREQARNGSAFVLLSGSSGSGKSSLARAGVVPAIVENEIDEQVSAWRTVIVTPSELAPDPIASLVRLLAADGVLPELRGEDTNLDDLIDGLRSDPALTIRLRFKNAFAQAAKAKGSVRVLVLVDQLEELFAAATVSDSARREFLEALEALARSSHVWVLATVRSDFWPQVQAQPTLVRMIEGRGPLTVLPPQTDALRRLIEEPARLAGLSFEQREGQSLADRILRDAATHAELLPLLEYVLRELFEQRTTEGCLSFAAYESLDGVEGALAKRAETVFTALPDDAQKCLVPVLKSLVTVGEEGEKSGGVSVDEKRLVRQRAPTNQFPQGGAARKLVDAFVAERLFTTSEHPQSGEASLTIAHESLLRVWPRAVTWAANNRDFLQARLRLRTALTAWQQEKTRRSDLLLPQGKPLEDARVLAQGHGADLTSDEHEFIRGSVSHHEALERKSRRRRRLAFAVLSVLTVLALVGGGVAWRMKNQGDELLWEASKSDSEESLRKLATGDDWNTAVAYGARALRIRPGNAAAARLLFGHTLLTGMPPSRILAHDGPVTQAQFLPDSSSLLTVSGGTLRRWEPSAGNRWTSRDIFTAGKGEKILALSPVGDRLCLIAPDGSARLWNVSTTAAGASLGDAKASAAVFSLDGSRVLTVSGTGPVVVWDTQSGAKVASFSSEGDVVTAAALAPDGSHILTGTKKGAVRCLKQVGNGEAAKDQAVWDGKQFVRKHAGNAEAWEVEWTLEDAFRSEVAEMTISPDSSRFSAVSRDGEAASWSMPTRFQVASLKAEQPAATVAYSDDGSMVATGGTGGSVQLWERASGKSLAFLRGHRGAISALSFSGDGRFLLSASEDETARLWELARCPREASETSLDASTPKDAPPVPGWVYESLLPFLCGKELDREGKISDLPVARQLAAQNVVEQQIAKVGSESAPPTSPWDCFLKWKFLSDSRTRPISPDATQSVPEFVEKNLWTNAKLADEAAVRAAWLAAPGHPMVQWALGKTHAGGVWGVWLWDRSLRRLADPTTGALYGAESVARWAQARVAMDAGESLPTTEFTNSLGMKFVPVAVSGGKNVLFSVWDTRVQDYAAYAGDQAGVDGSWKDATYQGQKLCPTEDCPVLDVGWADAHGFCQWLTTHEQKLGKITARQRYRLPTDEEWSWAVGIGEEEAEALRGRSPTDKDKKVTAYPWGTLKFPPLDDQGKPLGNYADSDYKKAFPDLVAIPGYTDGYATTSPVGSFPANAHGLYDLGGNVWQWCEDWYDSAEKKSRVVRGASWYHDLSPILLSSCRYGGGSDERNDAVGFRCVLGEDSSAP